MLNYIKNANVLIYNLLNLVKLWKHSTTQQSQYYQIVGKFGHTADCKFTVLNIVWQQWLGVRHHDFHMLCQLHETSNETVIVIDKLLSIHLRCLLTHCWQHQVRWGYSLQCQSTVMEYMCFLCRQHLTGLYTNNTARYINSTAVTFNGQSMVTY